VLQETKKTHIEVKQPRFSIRGIADYMAASEQVKRTIAQACKYRSIARVVQHNDAKLVISNHIRSGAKNAEGLIKMAEHLRNKLADDEFEKEVNEHNADYIQRFAEVFEKLELPNADLLPTKHFTAQTINGVKITFSPQLLLQRTTKTNKIKSGALMLRYAKGKTLLKAVATYQSAAAFGFLRALDAEEMVETDRSLCITVDAYQGICHEAPGNSVYLFKEMKAACATIAERWPAIKPPKNAVL
jgi:hypothetical protein